MKIIDFTTGSVVIAKVENNAPYSFLKKIIFSKYKNFIHPDFMALGDTKKYLTDIIPFETETVVVYNLLEEISEYVLTHSNLFISGVYENMKTVKELFDNLKLVYVDLDIKTLINVIKYILYKKGGFKNFEYEIKDYINNVENEKKNFITLQAKINSFTLDKNIKMSDIFMTNNKKYKYDYSVITCLISMDFSDISTRYSKKYLKEILSNIELDEVVAGAAINNEAIKIYKTIDKETVKKWFFSDDDLKTKMIKGITFKIKSDNFEDDSYYYTGIISEKSSGLVIRINRKKNEHVRFEDLGDIVKTGIDSLIKKIKRISDISFKDEKYSVKNITYSVIQISTIDNFNLKRILIALKEFPKEIFIEEGNNSPNRLVKIKYLEKGQNVNIIIKNADYIKNDTIIKNNTIELVNITSFTDIDRIMNLLAELLVISKTKKLMEFKNEEIVEKKSNSKDKKTKIKPIIPSKILKKAGVDINIVSCQKKRQPSLYDPDIFKSVETYILDYNGKKYVCPNNGYKFPGFTSQKSICCFTKDQRNKDIYKTMINSSETDIVSDSFIINKTRLLNNLKSPVLKDRLGALPKKIQEIFMTRDIYRFGVDSGDNDVLLNAFNKTSLSKKTPKDLTEFIKKNFPLETTPDKINSKKYIKYLEFLFKKNAVVIESAEDFQKFNCDKISGFVYQHTIFLLRRDIFQYELLVEKVSANELRKFFTKDDILFKHFIEKYNKSCVIKYNSGANKTPYNIQDFIDRGYKISGQILNSFDEIIYIYIKDLGLVPIVPYNKLIPDIPLIKDISSVKMDAKKQYLLLQKSNIDYLQVKGVSKNKQNKVDALVINSGITIPVLPSPDKFFDDIPVLFYGYYGVDIDNALHKNKPSYRLNHFNFKVSQIEYYRELYYRLKLTLSYLLNKNQELKNDIHKTPEKTLYELLSKEVYFSNKNTFKNIGDDGLSKREICSLKTECSSDTFCSKNTNKCLLTIDKKIFKNFIKRLADEIKWNKDILSGKISKEKDYRGDFISRESEILLLTDKDIEVFFSKKK